MVDAKLFLSWCHRNETLKAELLDLLKPRLKILGDVSVLWWEDSDIEIGEPFRRAILKRLDEADYGLQLLSVEFFASDFIVSEELPPFVSGAKPALPVGLCRFPLDGTFDLQGIDALQIYTLEGKFFSELRGHRRQDFATGLATKIRSRILGLPAWSAL